MSDDIYRILSLDGGGIRGMVVAQFLADYAKEKGIRVHDYFDLFTGTSTGGILALLLAKGASAEECIDLYMPDNSQRIMNASFWDNMIPLEVQSGPKYDGKGKLKVLQDAFGDTRIRDLDKDVLVTAYDLTIRKIVTFKRKGSDAGYNPTLAEVADASSAAPTYFPTVESSATPSRWLLDGGIAINDPSMCAVAEALRKGIKLENIRLLSIGTGIQTRYINVKDYGEKSQDWGSIEWLKNGLVDHLFSGGTSAVEYQCETLLGKKYFKVNGLLDYCSDDLDNVTHGNIDNLRRLGKQWYEDNEDKLGFLDV